MQNAALFSGYVESWKILYGTIGVESFRVIARNSGRMRSRKIRVKSDCVKSVGLITRHENTAPLNWNREQIPTYIRHVTQNFDDKKDDAERRKRRRRRNDE